jgi:hypothetical protein
MVQAVEDFFPHSGILDDEGIITDAKSPTSEPYQLHPMRRLSIGVDSIVGEGNGDRPGGYVLVIDGTALGYVRVYVQEWFLDAYLFSRLSPMTRTSNYCSALGLDARASSVVVFPLFRRLLL